jgi:hypothetical protein
MFQRVVIDTCPLALWMLMLLGATPGFAWGPDGHRIVCEIAYQEVGPAGKKLVADLMAGDAEDPSFASACNWPDRLRSQPQFDWVKASHFVNIPVGKTFDPGVHCPAKGCAARAIGQNARTLAASKASRTDRREALKYLGHFIGDLHQPLHVSYSKDSGGNSIKTRLCTADCRNLKLHSVWDSGILEAERKTWRVLARELRLEITTEQREAWRPFDVEAVISESFGIAERFAYRAVKGGAIQEGYIGQLQQPVKLDASYVATMAPVVREQLEKAGVRLAAVLDEIAAGQLPDGLTRVTPLAAVPSDAVGKHLFVREQPTTTAGTLARLAPGERIEILGEILIEDGPDWYVVRLDDGRQAYVRADYAEVSQ